MNKNFQSQRIRNVQRSLQNQKEKSALLLSSAPEHYSSRDQHHAYRQASDFFFLTGELNLQKTILLITADKVTIFSEPVEAIKVVWDGPQPSAKALAKALKADIVLTKLFESEAAKALRGIEKLFYQSEPQSLALQIAKKLFETPSHLRGTLPRSFAHSDLLLEPLRLFKDKEEIELIRKANAITNVGLLCALPLLRPGKSEEAIAATIDYSFAAQGAENAFASIVATGKNAATLHHRAGQAKIRAKDFVLVDVGARFDGYCADITRTLPASSDYSSQHQEVYEVVLRAQRAALSKVKHGVFAQVLYDAAVKELAYGLKHLGILKKSVSEIIAKRLYLPYFPHGIGHTLGIDIHDIGNLRGNNSARLEEGMVITVEPGLYLREKRSKIDPIGVRIEDNVKVTRTGCEILSEGFPKELSKVSALLNE